MHSCPHCPKTNPPYQTEDLMLAHALEAHGTAPAPPSYLVGLGIARADEPITIVHPRRPHYLPMRTAVGAAPPRRRWWEIWK